MKKVGFRFEETMAGTYTLGGKPDEQRQLSFTCRATASDALQHLRDGMTRMEGTLDMEGFADDVPIAGTIEIAVLRKRIIRYEFQFVGNDGEPYRFAGQKEIKLSNLLGTMTSLGATVTDARGNEVARARVAFDLRADLLPFLASWKPAVA
jgi:hypothetical protein